MAKFSVGSKVVHLVSGQHGVIVEVFPARRGRQLYKVAWSNGISEELEVNLTLDCDISDPFERCANGLFGSFSEYAKKNTTFKIKNSNNSTISSLRASKTLFRAYQFKPLLKFLNSPNRRLLVADEVGLGKTIEAGHIMLELKARRELRNVLIVCPKSLREKWKAELNEKFGLSFKIYEKAKDLISEMSDYQGDIKAIINYELIRMKRDDEDDEDEVATSKRIGRKKKRDFKKNRVKDPKKDFIDFLSLNGCKFSLVLCDEAHKMRNRSTQTYKGAEIVLSMADACVFLTATPIMISRENLFNLLHLLDNTRYFNYQIFENLIQQNSPFIWALSQLNHNVPLQLIKDELCKADIFSKYSADDKEIFSEMTTVGECFQKDPIFQEMLVLMDGEDCYSVRARLQYLLSSMSIMNNVFSRTRKREVTMDLSQAERKPHPRKIVLTDRERVEFEKVINEYIEKNTTVNDFGEEVLETGKILGLIQKKRQVASSVFAYLNTDDNLEKGVDLFSEFPDAKIDELIEIIEEVFKHGVQKVVVFALFRKTLNYIKIRLKANGYGCLMIHGDINNRAEILERFKNNPNAHILLSSEVGSEGLDMQFCNSMVNYDLPWNPMVVEQRIGRIDRFGQQSPVVNIYNLIVADSIQEDIYMRLLDRIGIFRNTIGDLEAILDAPMGKDGELSIHDIYNKLEKELYISKLTQEERQRKIDEVERAVENERENIRQLEEGLTNTLTNDAYFKDEINRILNNNAYVTETELKNYLDSVIRQELTTCNLIEIESDVYELKLPLNNPKVLKNFLTTYQPVGEEFDVVFNKFKREIDDKVVIRLTFNQQKAYDNWSLLFLNLYHPIIQASLCYFMKNVDRTKTSFCYALKDENHLFDSKLYYMALYQLSMHRVVQGVEKHTETLLPILYDAKMGHVVSDRIKVDAAYSNSQISGLEYNISNDDISRDAIDDMRYEFADFVNKEMVSKVKELKNQAESDRLRNEQQTLVYYKSRIDNLERNINEWESELECISFDNTKERSKKENAIRLARANVSQLIRDRNEHLELINRDPQIGIESELLSVNLIKII